MDAGAPRPLPRLALAGFAVAGTSPLALVVVTLAGVTGLPPKLLVPATALGLALFLAPLAVWLGYSRTVASSGGLYAFVAQAVGPRLARVQGWVWTISYILYLPYTVTYIVYYLLPYVWPLPAAWSRALEIALPIAICLLVTLADRAAIYLLLVLSALQVAAIAGLAVLVLGAWGMAHGPIVLVAPVHALPAFVGGAGQVSLLIVCLSLVVFLGGEAAGGDAVRWALGVGFAVVAGAALLGAWLLAKGATPAVLRSWLPGVALADRHAPHGVGVAIGALVLAGIAAVIVAEFIALVRLGRGMLGLDHRTAAVVVSSFFIAADAASLTNPERFYTLTIGPSVAALYLSQLLVFAAYPLLARDGRRRGAGSWLVAAVAAAWSLFGLYGAVTSGSFL